MSTPLTIIIPSHNSERTLARCLAALSPQVRLADELLVIDDHSTDSTAAIVRGTQATLLPLSASRGRIAARAAGVLAAQHDLLVFIDSDVVVPEEFIETVRRTFHEIPNLAGLYCRLAAPGDVQSIGGRYKNIYMHSVFESLAHDAPVLYGSAHAVRKEHFAKINSHFTGVEDNALGLLFKKKNLKIEYLKNLEVLHLKEYSFIQLLRNDYSVARKWVPLLLLHSRNSTHPLLQSLMKGFLHAPPKLLIAVLLCPLAVVSLAYSAPLWIACIIAWIACNYSLLTSLWRLDRENVVAHFGLVFMTQLAYGFGVARGLFDYFSASPKNRSSDFPLEDMGK